MKYHNEKIDKMTIKKVLQICLNSWFLYYSLLIGAKSSALIKLSPPDHNIQTNENYYSQSDDFFRERLFDKKKYPIFYKVVEEMKLYKTINTHFHAGHLYEHCMWTAQVIDEWFELARTNPTAPQASWVNGLNEESLRTILVLSAFLHDMPKAANLNYPKNKKNDDNKLNKEFFKNGYQVGDLGYFHTCKPVLKAYPYYNVIASHPEDGFEMFLPEADGAPKSPEDFFHTTNITPISEAFKIPLELRVDYQLNKITSLNRELRDELKNRLMTFLSNKNNFVDKSINFAELFKDLEFQTYAQPHSEDNPDRITSITGIRGEEGLVQSAVRLLVSEERGMPKGTIRKEDLMKGYRINFRALTKELGLSEIDHKFIAILIGNHWAFGATVVASFYEGKDKEKRAKSIQGFDKFIQRLGEFATIARYNNGLVDKTLVHCSAIIGAADVRGSTVVENYDNFINRYDWFKSNKALFEKPSTHGQLTCVYIPSIDKKNPISKEKLAPFNRFDMANKGLRALKGLLKYFKEKYPKGYRAPSHIVKEIRETQGLSK